MVKEIPSFIAGDAVNWQTFVNGYFAKSVKFLNALPRCGKLKGMAYNSSVFSVPLLTPSTGPG